MSQAEELLNELSETVSNHSHVVKDTDSYFVIDPSTRQITNTARKKNVLFVGDHNSEVYTFEVPRYVEGHDMTLCTSVKVHYNNIDSENGNENASVIDLYDLQINPANPETAICSWKIKRQVIQLVGILSFALQYLCADREGKVTYEWHTDIYSDVEVKAGRNNSIQAVFEYTDILEQWRARIFGAADSIKSEFEDVSNEQQELIKQEGSKQIAAVVDKGVEVLATIPGDYTATFNMAEEAVRGMAGAIEVVAEGETVVINDSSNLHLHGLNVYGKSSQIATTGAQLFDATTEEVIIDNPNVVYEADGDKVTYSAPQSYLVVRLRVDHRNLIAGKTYVLECDEFSNGLTCQLLGNDVANGMSLIDVRLTGTTKRVEFVINEEIDMSIFDTFNGGIAYLAMSIFFSENTYNNAELIIKGLRLYSIDKPMMTWEPYSGGIPAPNPSYPQEIESVDKPTITLKSKNLASLTASGSITSKGTEMTVNDDGSITVAGTAAGAVLYTIADNLMLLPGTYTLSGCPNGGGDLTYDLRYGEGGLYRDFGEGNTFTITEPMVSSLGMMIRNGTTLSNVVFRPMIMEASIKDTKFEKAINQSLLVAQKLHGIPVESGGNYTDPTGQQWVCDEIDLERGVKVQRVFNKALTEDEAIDVYVDDTRFYLRIREIPEVLGAVNSKVLCSHFPHINYQLGDRGSVGVAHAYNVRLYFGVDESFDSEEKIRSFFASEAAKGTPVTIYYPLAAPIEIPLTAEEIEAYKTLRSYYPNTTVFNDVNAFMRVKYVSDTKTYIDNKFAELASLITSQNN